MGKSALELIPVELQDAILETPDLARAIALVIPTKQKVRDAADSRLGFEDEPAAFIKLLRAEAKRR
jgi:hypothetical protein